MRSTTTLAFALFSICLIALAADALRLRHVRETYDEVVKDGDMLATGIFGSWPNFKQFSETAEHHASHSNVSHEGHHGIHVVSIHWEFVKRPLVLCAFVFVLVIVVICGLPEF